MRRRAMASAILAVALAGMAALGGCVRPAPDDPAEGYDAVLQAAIDSLAADRDAQGLWPEGQVPYVVEVASAARLDLDAWPHPVPVAQQIAWPAEDASFLGSLRPLHAAALVAVDAGDEATLDRVRQRVMAGFDGRQFGDPRLLNDDAFALIVLGAARAAGSDDLDPAIGFLLDHQTEEGGWSWSVGGEAETDMTGIVLRAFAEAGAIDRVDAQAAASFLESTRATDGGYAAMPGGRPNCDSTVWGIRGLDSLALSSDADSWRFLFSLQTELGADRGYSHLPGGPPNALCTAEVATLLALLVHHDLPVPPGLDQAD